MILVEQVALPLIEGETVGVIHPADGGGSVERRALVVGDMGTVLDLEVSGLLQNIAGHDIDLLLDD